MADPEAPESAQTAGGLLRISAVAAVAGVGVGLVGGSFRWVLLKADTARVHVIGWAHHLPAAGWLVPVLLVALCAALARFVVRLVPLAAGSGVQAVEAVWRGELTEAPWTVLPAKFIGGVLAIGSGMALGREGPTIHMGAVVGSEAGRRTGLGDEDQRILQTALGGAGLGVAFNAPLGGAMFVFEEVAKTFRLRLTLVTLIGSATAIACSRALLGDQPDFLVGRIPTPSGWLLVAYLIFGAATGLLGAAYNVLIVGALDLVDHFRSVPPEVRAAVVGGVVGLVVWFEPLIDGGGDVLVQRLLGGGIGVAALIGYFLVRFFLGPWSYSAGTPGGIFAPLLAVGALWGSVVHAATHPFLPSLGAGAASLAIVGMTAFFAAVVRAPVTGIVLIVEMTATTSLLIPMLAACFAAVVVTNALGNEPIYDTLRKRMPGLDRVA